MTNRDPNQIAQFEHDGIANAKRVIVIGQDLSIDSDKIAKAVKEGLQGLSNTDFSKSAAPSYTPIEVEKTVYIPQLEVKIVEVPVIVKEIEYREIEKPIIIEKIVTVEVPVIVKEIEYRETKQQSNDLFKIKFTTIIRDICMLGLMIYHLFSHIK